MKSVRILPVLMSLLLRAGCTMPSGDELLAAPKPPGNYQTLQTKLEELLASGVSYTTPTAGENRSSVQLVDLDGDGAEEAIVFFRGATSATSNDFKVYIYKKNGDDYRCTGSIEAKGAAIQSVEYPTITPDGGRGIVVTWQLAGNGTGALTMCDFDDSCAPRVLLETDYSALELTDMDGDGAKDLLLLTGASGKRTARLYRYKNGRMNLAGEAAMSAGIASVERMEAGHITDGLPAVFAEEKMASGIGLTTDIFVYSDGMLVNLALDGEDIASRSTFRPVQVYAADINSDGVIELPRAVLMAGYKDAAAHDALYMLDWYAYGLGTTPVQVSTTYQCISDAWSLRIDRSWHDRITAVKSTDGGLSMVSFYEYRGAGQSSIPLFNIYCVTGSSREYYAGRTDLIQLGQTSQAVYFAKIPEGAQSGTLKIGAEEISSRFSIVKQAWNN